MARDGPALVSTGATVKGVINQGAALSFSPVHHKHDNYSSRAKYHAHFCETENLVSEAAGTPLPRADRGPIDIQVAVIM